MKRIVNFFKTNTQKNKNRDSYRLFNINNYTIDTSRFKHLLHDNVEQELEEKFARYVGAKYACIANSASSLIYLSLMGVGKYLAENVMKKHPVRIPSMIPVAVSHIINNLGIHAEWKDDVDWVGKSYVLYDTEAPFNETEADQKIFKIIDSAQEVRRNQFAEDANDEDMMIFSLYPTKPVGGIDGGIMVSNSLEKIRFFRAAVNLGVGSEMQSGSWKRTLLFPGWKLHPNSLQCYFALKNLEKLDAKNERLDQISAKYNDAFDLSNSSRHLYRIDVEDRERFMKKLDEKSIEPGIHYGAAHIYPFYQIKTPENMEQTDNKSRTTVSIPFNESLSDTDVDFIIKTVKESR